MNRFDRERIALMCDQLIKRGVPRVAVQPVVDWLDGWGATTGHALDGAMVCMKCGWRYQLYIKAPRCDKNVTGQWRSNLKR